MPHPFLISSQLGYLILVFDRKFAYLMTNSADPDQLASSEGHVMFSKRRVKFTFKFTLTFMSSFLNKLADLGDSVGCASDW